jgi:hypothetical protein
MSVYCQIIEDDAGITGKCHFTVKIIENIRLLEASSKLFENTVSIHE